MARLAGRNGRVYLGIASSSAAAEPFPYSNKWTLDAASDKIEVTAMGDSNKTYVGGLPDASGTFSGFYDNATAQTYTAAQDGQARKFYLYPDITATTQYWFGTVLVDFSVESGVSDAITTSASWSAASAITKVG